MKVLVADKFEDCGIEGLKGLGCEVVYQPDLKDAALADAVGKVAPQLLVVRGTTVTADMISASKELKLIVRAGAGTNTIDVKTATANGVRVANCPGKNSVAVAELTLGLMLALDRRIVHNTVDLRAGIWNKKEYSKARGLKGRTLGIVGFGKIGYEVARRAKAFEMDIVYYDVVNYPDQEQELGLRRVPLEDLLKVSDFVTVHVPLIDPTRHMFSTAQFKLMKPTAFIINCSRGGVVDEKALAAALDANQIAGAALDVYEIEPEAGKDVMRDPITRSERVYGTHHIGASTEEAQIAIAYETVRIVKQYLDDGQVLNCVN